MTARQMKACTKGGEGCPGVQGSREQPCQGQGSATDPSPGSDGGLALSLRTVAPPDGSLCVKLTQVWEEGLGLVGGIRRQLWSLGQGRWAE